MDVIDHESIVQMVQSPSTMMRYFAVHRLGPGFGRSLYQAIDAWWAESEETRRVYEQWVTRVPPP